jgi:hypothetical protein
MDNSKLNQYKGDSKSIALEEENKEKIQQNQLPPKNT